MLFRSKTKQNPGGIAPGGLSLHASGFTLIELLVVIAILALLAALVITGTGQAMSRARQTKCLSNMRQMGVALHLYSDNHEGVLPGTSHGISWVDSLGVYLSSNFIGRCPAVPQHRARMTYGFNDCLAPAGGGMKVDACRTPGETMAVGELALQQTSEHFHFAGIRGGPSRLTANQFMAEVNVTAHVARANYLFVDGRADSLTWAEVQQKLAQNNSTFVVP